MSVPPIRDGVELAWAAGAFEGEGCITFKTTKGRRYAQLTISQHGGDEAVAFLQRFVDAVGFGRVLGPYEKNTGLGTKPRYLVQLQSQKQVAAVVSALEPYMTPLSPKLTKYRGGLVR